jgi:hypothetical protein
VDHPACNGDEIRCATTQQQLATGRLKPGATGAAATGGALNTANLDRFPQYGNCSSTPVFHDRGTASGSARSHIRGTLYLLGRCCFVPLIGAVNIANPCSLLNLRMKELATRVALGAGRSRVARRL